MRRVVGLSLLLALAAPAVFADDAPSLAIAGAVDHPQQLTIADLKALPPTTLDVTFMTGHGEEHGRFTGALLWTLLDRAALSDTKGKHPDLHHTLVATGSYARQTLATDKRPCDAVIMAIVDSWEIGGGEKYRK